MRRFIILVLLIFVTTISAQDSQRVVWNWAWKESSSELVAYSQNGDVNILGADFTYPPSDVWRISDSEAIGLINFSERQSLFLLSSQGIEEVSKEFESEQFDQFIESGIGLRAISYNHSYFFFTTWNPINQIPTKPLMFLDLRTLKLHLLSETASSSLRLDPHSNIIRYVEINQVDDLQYAQLIEYTLMERTEQILFETSSTYLSVDSDLFGETWLFLEYENDIDSFQYRLYEVETGDEEIIYIRDLDLPYYSYALIDDDFLINYSPICSIECIFQLWTDEGETFNYLLPENNTSISHFYRANNNNLIIGNLYGFWMMSLGKPAHFLGYHYRGGSHLPSTVSPDKRYALIAETELYPQNNRQIIDLATQEIILIVPESIEDPLTMTYLNSGFIINTTDAGNALLYHYVNQEIIELPDLGYGTYFELLPDGSVLQNIVTGNRENQIFRYFPQTNEQVLLIEGVTRIRIYESQ